MDINEIQNAVKHLVKTSKCLNCAKQYEDKDINVLTTTQHEGLFELRCHSCNASTIVTVLMSPESELKERIVQNKNRSIKSHSTVSDNDILDIKNFLNNFDGNFKKIFTKEN